jgi:hypothetical protein
MRRTHPRGRARAAFATAGLTIATLAVAACSGGGPGPSGPGAAGGLQVQAEGVVLQDGVRQMDKATAVGAIESIAEDGTLVFKAGAAGVADLKAGNVLVIEGVTARKITSVTSGAAGVEVATEDAAITDIVKDGKLGWTWGIDFNNLPEATYQFSTAGGLQRTRVASNGGVDARTLHDLAVAGTAMRFAGKVSGFDVELKLTPKAGQMDIEVSASRHNVKIQAAGFITNFVQETRMEFDDGEGQLFETTVSGLKGEAEVTWNAFQVNDPSLDSDITAVEIPFSLPLPAMIGPVPVTINIKANIRVVPELTSGQASSGGAWKVTYDTEHGFSTNGGDPTPVSKLASLVADLGGEPTVTAGLGVVGFGAGFEFPRVELQLGHPFDEGLLKQVVGGQDLYQKASALLRPYVFLTLNTYINGLWTPGTTLSGDIPPCQRSSVKISAIAGYKLSVLGMAELSNNKLIWEKSYDRFKDDKPCTLTGE